MKLSIFPAPPSQYAHCFTNDSFCIIGTTRMVLRNLVISATTLVLATGWTAALAFLQQRNKISRGAVRKAIHLTAGPIMTLTWPLYSTGGSARVIASIVPLWFAIRLRNSANSDKLCTSMARSGDHVESRGGPFWYCVCVATTVLVLWRESRATYAIIGALCFGDGAAELVGRKLNGPLWPIPRSMSTKKKSVMGSIGFFTASFTSIYALVRFGNSTNACAEKLSFARITLISASSAVAEILPFEDNITVPITAAVVALL